MKKIHFLPIMVMLLLPCLTKAQMAEVHPSPESYSIHWPEKYSPEKANFFVHNEIDIAASPAQVWEILIAASTWPEWYEGASDVQLRANTSGKLEAETVFSWKTMGLNFESTIKEYVPNSRLSWESTKKSIQGYHAWLIIPTTTGCKLITEESQHGWLTILEKTFQPKKLHRLHDIWLREIKQKAEQ